MTWNLKFCLLAKLQSTSLGVPCPSWRVYQTLQPNWMIRWSCFFSGGWWVTRCATRNVIQKLKKKNVTSEFTNNEKHCHVFSCIKVESRRCFSTRVGNVLAYANDSWHRRIKTNDNNNSRCDNKENNSRCDNAISISNDNKQQLFVLEWWSRKARLQKLKKKC